MVARPALTALGCRSCQHAMYRAVLATSVPAWRMLPQIPQTRRMPLIAPRAFSTEQKETPLKTKDELSEELEKAAEPDESDDTPWFLEEEPPRHPPSQHKANLPKIPEDAPAMLDPMLKYIYEDMGLDDISMLDLRDIDPPASLGHNLIMLFATTRSERHLHISSGRFVRWLRRNYKVQARAEGLIGAGELKTKLRRLRKKAKLMGQNTAMIPGGDNGISTGWVCVNFKTNESTSPDEANFDDSGSFSGFGSSLAGTTVVVQCMTEARRNELDLEQLWKGILRRNLEQQTKIRGERADPDKIDQLLASKLQIKEEAGASQFDAMKKASQQHRYFSTSARRLSPQSKDSELSTSSPNTPSNENETQGQEAEAWQQDLVNVLIGGSPLDAAKLENTVSAILTAPLTTGATAKDRLTLVDQLLQTGNERGLPVLSRQMFVTLIESLVTSPAYGPELGRAQKNFEMLLTERAEPLEIEEVARLMNAYAYREDWDRFWDVFRNPSRHDLPRSSLLYELAYRTMTATKDAAMCAETLRWVYPEMLTERPPVEPRGPVYRSLRSCILVADPLAEEYLHNPPHTLGLPAVEKRAIENREFVKVLREVEALRTHLGDN